MNDTERAQWIDNDESLYLWQTLNASQHADIRQAIPSRD